MPPLPTRMPRGRAFAPELASSAICASSLDMGQIGMAADGAGRRAGRIEKHRIEGLPAAKSPHRRRWSCREPEAVEICLAAAPCAPSICRPPSPWRPRGELRRLAAGCGAEIEHALARDIAEEQHRKPARRVLHPPGAFAEAGKRSIAPVVLQA